MNQVLAFINQVDAFIESGSLSASQGQPLIDAGNAIVDLILAGG